MNRTTTRTLTLAEVDRLYHAAGDDETRCLILLAVTTGLRKGDLMALRREAINGNVLTVTEAKTGQTRTLSLSDVVVDHVGRLPQTGLLFAGIRERCDFHREWRALTERAGVSTDFHALRRTALEGGAQ